MDRSEKQSKYTPHTAWKPGQSGNPNGRPPKGHSISEAVKKLLDENPDIREGIVKQISLMALNGDISTIRTLWGYMDGLPAQSTDITSGGEKIETPMIILDTQEPHESS